jgi:hypothetical protein
MRLGKEKRKFARLDKHYIIKYKTPDKGVITSFGRDLSAGGVRFHSKEEIKPGSIVEMTMNLPPFPRPIKAELKIAFARPLKKLGGFNIGAEFVKIDDEARDFIEKITPGGKKQKKEKEEESR